MTWRGPIFLLELCDHDVDDSLQTGQRSSGLLNTWRSSVSQTSPKKDEARSSVKHRRTGLGTLSQNSQSGDEAYKTPAAEQCR